MSEFFKVIEIADSTRIIINYGLNDVNHDNDIIGKEIKIVEKGIELKDPDSNEIIGNYNPIKEKLIITDTYDTFSIARKKIVEDIPAFSTRAFSPMLANKQKTSYKKLNILEEENKNIKLKNQKIIIGDLVQID